MLALSAPSTHIQWTKTHREAAYLVFPTPFPPAITTFVLPIPLALTVLLPTVIPSASPFKPRSSVFLVRKSPLTGTCSYPAERAVGVLTTCQGVKGRWNFTGDPGESVDPTSDGAQCGVDGTKEVNSFQDAWSSRGVVRSGMEREGRNEEFGSAGMGRGRRLRRTERTIRLERRSSPKTRVGFPECPLGRYA